VRPEGLENFKKSLHRVSKLHKRRRSAIEVPAFNMTLLPFTLESAAVNIKNTVFWDSAPCSLVNRAYQRFGGMFCLRF
jgi:hypothetical protein